MRASVRAASSLCLTRGWNAFCVAISKGVEVVSILVIFFGDVFEKSNVSGQHVFITAAGCCCCGPIIACPASVNDTPGACM
jgi:hypothetical protein